MKYTSRDKDDGGCISRLKRIKHEPLSPPSIHSEDDDDEQSGLSDESDEEELLSSAIPSNRIVGDLNNCINNSDHSDQEQDDNATNHTNINNTTNAASNNMRVKQEFPNGATKDIKSYHGDQATCENETQIGLNGQLRPDHLESSVIVSSPEAHLLSLTPPILDTTPAIDIDHHHHHNHQHDDEINPTKLTSDNTSAYTNRYTQDTRDHRHHNHHHSHRRPSISRDRCDDSPKLSEQQQEYLSHIIRTIKEDNYVKFSELLGRNRDSTEKLLNAFVDGQTALHYSLIYGRSSAWCKQLVMNGANPNQTNRAGWHPIHLAAYNCSTDTMLYLIDCYAEW
uniref:Notch-regulated ankyrin repeat-containing protein n=1 Tax=Aceria tosichella TaxID=561515 RepID=A0A6G1S943_9ACAR